MHVCDFLTPERFLCLWVPFWADVLTGMPIFKLNKLFDVIVVFVEKFSCFWSLDMPQFRVSQLPHHLAAASGSICDLKARPNVGAVTTKV